MSSIPTNRPILGIVGGLGGLASAEFLRTIYEENPSDPESDGPVCFLQSDPDFPDRTQAILDEDDRGLPEQLARSLETLRALGASRTVICCITLHNFLPKVDRALSASVISLVDLIIEGIKANAQRHLVLGTTGSKVAGILARQPGWGAVEEFVVFPNDEEQSVLHSMLYDLKRSPVRADQLFYLDEVRRAHGASRVIAGCTEVHLLHKASLSFPETPHISFEDPLMRLAQNLDSYLIQKRLAAIRTVDGADHPAGEKESAIV